MNPKLWIWIAALGIVNADVSCYSFCPLRKERGVSKSKLLFWRQIQINPHTKKEEPRVHCPHGSKSKQVYFLRATLPFLQGK